MEYYWSIFIEIIKYNKYWKQSSFGLFTLRSQSNVRHLLWFNPTYYFMVNFVSFSIKYNSFIFLLISSKSSATSKTLVLLSNLTVHGLAYDANQKTLFLIENQSRTLRMYTPILCDTSTSINMHSWSLNNISNSIRSMEIDVNNKQIIFASNYQFMISNMSEPNSTTVAYTTDREIKRFIYGMMVFNKTKEIDLFSFNLRCFIQTNLLDSNEHHQWWTISCLYLR